MCKKVDNILHVYQACSLAEIDGSRGWYTRARAWCDHRAQLYNLDVRTIAGVISALSPRNNWKRNLEDADLVLHAVHHGHSVAWVVAGTFRKSVEKAWDIAKYRMPELAETSPKTRAFLDCIDDPLSQAVTVDVWAMRVVEGDMNAQARNIKEAEYAEYEQAYRDAGKEVLLRPMEVQAVTWVAVRTRKRAKASANQLTMF